VRPRSSSAAGQETEVARLTRELNESLERQIATADVLNVISRSTFDLAKVLNTLLESATRLCEADKGAILRPTGTDASYYVAASYRHTPEYAEYQKNQTFAPGRSGVVGRVLLEGKSVQIPDVLADPQYTLREIARLGDFRTILGVPLLREGFPIGLFVLHRAAVRPFTDKQIKLVETFADQAVIAIENVRLFEVEQQRTRELTESLEQQTATSEVLRVISRSPGDLQPVFQSMLANATRLCEASFGVLLLREGAAFRVVPTHNAPPAFAELRKREPMVRSGVIERMLAAKQFLHISDCTEDASYKQGDADFVRFVDLAGVRTLLAVPMFKENEPVGGFGIYRQQVRPFTEKHIDLVKNFASQAVIAIENARLLNELRQRTTDLSESLEQQTATSKVLEVISRSAFDLNAVFETVAESSVRLCGADRAFVLRFDGELLRLVVAYNVPQEMKEFVERNPVRPGRYSASARAALERRTIHIPDCLADPEYTYGVKDVGPIRTNLAVPILKGDDLLGVMLIYHLEVRPFTDKQIALVETFADQAAIAIENVRLFEAEQQRTRELTESLEQQTATSNVLEVISRSAFDLQAVFDTVVESSARLCGADMARANIYRFDGELLRIVSTVNVPQKVREWLEQHPIRPGGHGGTARAALERRTIHIPDVLADRDYSFGAKAVEPYRTILGVPILKGDDLLGVILIYLLEVRPFTDKQIALVETFADQAAIAIENVRLLDALRLRTDDLGRSIEELRALGEVSQAVNSTLDLETVLSTIVTKAAQLSGTEAGAIYVFDDMQREFHLRATYGMDQELIEALTHQRIGLDEPNVVQALAQGEPVQVADLREGAPSAASEVIQVIQRAGFRALLVAPLLRGEDVVGMLVVRRKTPGAFPQNTVDLIKTFAAQSVLAIQNARLFDSVETRTRELAKSLGDLRTAQDRLVQTEKLASLGQLTAGIAHEIKNPLNFVNNFSSVSVELIDELREALGSAHLDSKLSAEITEIADTLQGNLDKVVQHGKRADAIVKNMLLHSRQGSGEHRPVDINALVDESLNLAYHGARAEKQGFNITLERSFDPAAGEVDLFPQEITRALLNLISNGFYAATKRRETNAGGYEPTLTAATKNLGNSVEIKIRDNGTGIPPEVKDKLFNPFFTTKPAGEGTGLGLSISHDIIVKQHGGSIEVDTQPGEFTEFRIVLPRAGASVIKSGERM